MHISFPGSQGEKINMRIINRKRVPVEETDLDVLVEVTMPSELPDPGVDIVTVLDVSPSKWGHDKKLEHLKASMASLIRQLRPIDRMSVVTFSTNAQKMYPLNLMTAEAQAQVEILVNQLAELPGSCESMSEALRLALQELNDNHPEGRMPVIFLISDSIDGDTYKDAAQIPPCNVPVHTFFFCRWSGFVIIREKAMNSKEGTFLYLNNSSKFEGQISRRWADVVTPLKDIKLTIRPVKVQIDDMEITTKIARVIDLGRSPSHLLQKVGRIVRINNLSHGEEHKILIKLHLPALDEEVAMEVIQLTYSCRYLGKSYDASPIMVVVTRTGQDLEKERDEVVDAQYVECYGTYQFRGILPDGITPVIGKATKSFNKVKDPLKTLNGRSQGSHTRTRLNQPELGGA